jgi:2-isopropylmalate synthase
MSKQIVIYDTTLRDGGQAEEINLTAEDKVRIARKLDELGVGYIEGGWPGANPTDTAFFKEIRSYNLETSKVAAFGMTCSPKGHPDTDKQIGALVASQAPVITIVGKTWDFHVTEALRTTLPRNLEIIRDSVAYLKTQVSEVVFDAEHFFDGFKANREFALACLKAAAEGGSDSLVLCDTNGGSLPGEIAEIIGAVAEAVPNVEIGFHAHNDSELAVANTLAAVEAGATHIQGTVNGYGERCGNANLCSILPNLELKMGLTCLPEGRLSKLTHVSNYISEVCNLRPLMRQPFVGRSAFAHKGGLHVSAIARDSRTYEHIEPELVGNEQRILLSDMSGRANILYKARKFGYDLEKDDPCVLDLLGEVKSREEMGYEYATAEASFELLFFRKMGWSKQYYDLITFRVLDSLTHSHEPFSEATVMLKVRGDIVHTAAGGQGPVNALDNALRKALVDAYPGLAEMRLLDFKVRVLTGYTRTGGGTASNVRVLIESGDKHSRWVTVGVSHNIIDASWQALVDSIDYKLFKDDPQKWPQKTPEGSSKPHP